MDLTELHHLVSHGESNTVEFKKTTADLAGACESLCAFLNGEKSGTVIIGVANGKLVGQEVSDHTQQEIANALDHIEPRVKVDMTITPVEGARKIIVLRTSSHPDLAPFVFRGRPFWRTGTATSIMPTEYHEELLREKIEKKHPFVSYFAHDYSIDMLDLDALDWVIREGIRLKRVPVDLRGKPAEALERFKLSERGKLKNAAAILFGKNLSNFIQCRVRMARFKGIDKSEFLDNRIFTGHAVAVYEEGMTFMAKHIPIWGKIESDSPFRKEDYLIPIDAFREAFVNAICHRDYSDHSGAITIAIFDDRMEIGNIGSLTRQIKVEDLKKSHVSIPRNQLIADAFYYSGLIEQWGRGTQKITNLCVKAKVEPEFVSDKFGFKIIFKAVLKEPPPEVKRLKEPSWSLRQRKIYDLLVKHKQLTLREFMVEFPTISKRRLQEDLLALKDKKLVESMGQARAIFWSLVSEETPLG